MLPEKVFCGINAGLSISFEVASSFWKVDVSLLSERRMREPPRGLDARKCYFPRFPDSIWALKNNQNKTILTIVYVYNNHSC